jgi:hypothetical protein
VSNVDGSCQVPARPGSVSWLLDCGVDPVGMSELHEQAITSIARTKDKTVNKTFLLGFKTFSFVIKVRNNDVLYNILGEMIQSIL